MLRAARPGRAVRYGPIVHRQVGSGTPIQVPGVNWAADGDDVDDFQLSTAPDDILPFLPAIALQDGGVACANGVHLTSREVAVLECVDLRLTNGEAALRLEVSVSTIKQCHRVLYNKLGLNRARLVVLWEHLRALIDELP